MSRSVPQAQTMVTDTLRAFGGQGTLGDIVGITGLPRAEVEVSLLALMAADRAHVRVSEGGVVVYHLGAKVAPTQRLESSASRSGGLMAAVLRSLSGRTSPEQRRILWDRKTLRLIRAREGVISLAELVEHTGLSLADAEEEMRRLAESYGGESHPSWDGHVVCAFPGLMTSASEASSVREPRPAWVRANDPMGRSGWRRRHETAVVVAHATGLVSSVAVPALVLSLFGAEWPMAVVGAVALLSIAGVITFGSRLFHAIEDHSRSRFRQPKTLRRYALGHVFETALKGKGVVSLDRTVRYLQSRAGRRTVSRSAVEKALRQLAREFDAVITEHNGDLFFGFRNVKRQFLASHVQRRELRLARTAQGRIVYDSADSPLEAAVRELDSFDRDLSDGTTAEADPGWTQLG